MGPLVRRQILLSKSCLFVPRLPWPDSRCSINEKHIMRFISFCAVLLWPGVHCAIKSFQPFWHVSQIDHLLTLSPGLWLTCRNFFFSGIREAFHSSQCNYVLDCVRRRGRLRLAALQPGDEVPAPRPCLQMRLRCHGARPPRSAADFD